VVNRAPSRRRSAVAFGLIGAVFLRRLRRRRGPT